MRAITYAVAGMAAGTLLTLAGPAPGNAHFPDECSEQALQARDHVNLYVEGLEELRQVPEDQTPAYIHHMQRAIRLSVDAVTSSADAVTCAGGEEHTEHAAVDPAPAPAEELSLDDILAFGREHEFALSVADRCFAIYYELIYDKRPRRRPFLDEVMAWAQSGAPDVPRVLMYRIDSARKVIAEMERLQVTEHGRYAFSQDYVRRCQEDFIRAAAGQ